MSNEYLNNKLLEAVIKRYQESEQEQIRYQLIIKDLEESDKRRIKCGGDLSHDINHYLTEYNRIKNEYIDTKNKLATAFQTLSEHLVRYAKDIIIDVDDATQEGIMICFEKIYRFHPDKGRAFNYMTTCILNHYRQIYRGHKNYKLLKERFKEHLTYKYGNFFVKNGREVYSNNEE